MLIYLIIVVLVLGLAAILLNEFGKVVMPLDKSIKFYIKKMIGAIIEGDYVATACNLENALVCVQKIKDKEKKDKLYDLLIQIDGAITPSALKDRERAKELLATVFECLEKFNKHLNIKGENSIEEWFI